MVITLHTYQLVLPCLLGVEGLGFLFFVLRAGGHNGVQLGILREAVNKRDGGVSEEQQPFAGIGMGHICLLYTSRCV